jgi:hypothetical protein
MNNMTVRRGLQQLVWPRRPAGDRTGVSPISMEAIEQVQVSIAPYDIAQGNFVGASVDTVTRSGTNSVRGSAYYRFRNDSFVGTEARGNVYNPGTFDTKQTGGWVGAPVVKNKLFVFGNFENEKDARPLYTARATTAVKRSAATSRACRHGRVQPQRVPEEQLRLRHRLIRSGHRQHAQKRGILRGDYNLNASNKIFFNYVQLNSSSDNQLSGSTQRVSAAARSPPTPSTIKPRTTRSSRTARRPPASGTR